MVDFFFNVFNVSAYVVSFFLQHQYLQPYLILTLLFVILEFISSAIIAFPEAICVHIQSVEQWDDNRERRDAPSKHFVNRSVLISKA